MGIKDLWPLLNPYCERKPLYELQGKIVAIDLAGWICESLCVVDYEVQPRFYLRNLFFRTCYLLLSGVTPVFVLEGTAPVLKHQMISKRNQIQFRGAKPRKNTQETNVDGNARPPISNKGRTRFNFVLKQCEELIGSMGLQCVQGPGEAEAFCAHLNARQLVDGVISQDSDCFAYGARRVFRNFSLSMQGAASRIGGAVDIYDLNVVEQSMDFGRNKVIVMALLCGCDYCPEGVGGVGRDAVQKLFSMYTETEILKRVQSWRENGSKFTELELKVDDKLACVNCSHYGRVQKHAKSGCDRCKTSVGCDSSLWKEKRLAIKSELQIRKKAMQVDDFPSQDIIDEFLQEPVSMNALQLDWCQPNLVKFVKMMGSLLQWDEVYCFRKFLPLLTRWQLHHFGDDLQNLPLRGNVQPDFIKKKRAPKGVASYEIVWKDDQQCFTGLIPDEQMQMLYSANEGKDQTEVLQSMWSTIEPIDLVQKAYPDLVERFIESKAKGNTKKGKKGPELKEKATKTASKRNSKKVTGVDNAITDFYGIVDENTNPSEKKATKRVTKKNTKKTAMAKPTTKLQTLDAFLQKKSIDINSNACPTLLYKSPSIKTSSKPLSLSDFSFNLNDSFGPMDNQQDLSRIINEMVTRPPNITEFDGKKLRFDDITSNRRFSAEFSSKVDATKVYDKIDATKKNSDGEQAKSIALDESLDEFDLMVMKKGCKYSDSKLKTISDAKSIKCSTPVLVNRFLSKNNSRVQSPLATKISPIANETSRSRKNSVIVSSFFATNAEDEIDLFEQSIDYQNMEDIGLVSSESDSESEDADGSPNSSIGKSSDLTLKSIVSSPHQRQEMINEDADAVSAHDTLDNFLGLNASYVPISNELRKLSSSK